MINKYYKFFRDSKSIKGFESSNTPSTDVINVLEIWAKSNSQRAFSILIETDDHIVVDMIWNEKDNSVRDDLNDACEKFGVDRCSYEC